MSNAFSCFLIIFINTKSRLIQVTKQAKSFPYNIVFDLKLNEMSFLLAIFLAVKEFNGSVNHSQATVEL